ncbi:hypothetical protein NIES25_48520 [Nostoc linckia NIES-25]|nr:hypothetical protein NIES25_48520 [Nostoc linckia NIES-25]
MEPNQEKPKTTTPFIPNFADDPDSISIPEDFFYQEDSGRYYDCPHCQGSGYLYGSVGWECPECSGTGVGGTY